MSSSVSEKPPSSDPSHLAAAARAMLASGRPAAARPLLAALERLAPDAPELTELHGALAAAEGRTPELAEALCRALAKDPNDWRALVRRADLFARGGDLASALRDAADAAIAAPREIAPKVVLGLLLTAKGEPERACVCLADALASDPSNPSIRLGLAEAASRTGDRALARKTLADGILYLPARADLRRALVRLALEGGESEGAAALAEAARRAGVVDAELLRMQAKAESDLGREGEAQEHLRLAFTLDPTDPALRGAMAERGMLRPGDRLPVAAVAHHFDGIATTYESAMIAAGDRIPGLMRQAIRAVCPLDPRAPLGPVLDLGCGTGFVALAASDLALGPWIGVDASARMLAIARPRGLYAELTEADVLEYLDTTERSFPLILAADVFSTFGDVTPVFAAVARRLAKGGHFIFSVDEMSPQASGPAWAFAASGRYVHSRTGIECAATGTGLSLQSITALAVGEEQSGVARGSLITLAPISDAC